MKVKKAVSGGGPTLTITLHWDETPPGQNTALAAPPCHVSLNIEY